MKHVEETERLFHKVLDETQQELKTQWDWSFDLSDVIDNRLKEMGMSKIDFAKRVGTSPAAVSRWLGGGHNFTLSTLARISTVLGIPLISVVK